jgi:hypothetical protein
VRNRTDNEVGGYSRDSACFKRFSREEKKRQSAPAEAMAPISAWRSRRKRYLLRNIAVGACRWRIAHSTVQFAERRSEAKRAIPACFLESSSNIYTP